ncbi:GH92 family glycosyl hydrolase [Haliscomenobacter sp.]|uniref:GH92 family glycosyl hydrolase n=1 Tax=Haliscomenobacter sp. TaxID=2717303 RepID=UPI003364FF96
MKKSLLLLCILLIFASTVTAQNLLRYVNPLVGTDSDFSLSSGNTYPAIALPWGMNFWTAQTAPNGDGWQYAYDANKIRGFKQTHQPSPWINDYGAFSLLPMSGKNPEVRDRKRGSWFSHKTEIAQPHYYQVYLADYDCWTEITPTERAAQMRFRWGQEGPKSVLLDAFDMGSMVKIIPAERKIIGYAQNNHGGVPGNFKNYFVAVFDQDFELSNTFNDTIVLKDLSVEGKHVGALVHFKSSVRTVNVKLASSFISPEQAELNLQREIGADAFDATKEKARQAWEKILSRVQVQGGAETDKMNFYTALYRVMLFPRKFFEYDAKGQIVHYSPYNGQVLPGYMFTDNGFWDTFRAVFPLFSVLFPELDGQIMQGLVNTYKESGWLPEWASPGHRDCMIGSNSASLITEAWLKGIRGFDIETLYSAMVKNSGGVGPVASVGRLGADYYNRLGYVPYNVGINENAARTLEYAYADYCIWQLGLKLGKPEAATFAKRAQNWRNVFDKSSNFMRGKNEDGSWQSPFRPDKWGDAFTEGSSWHYTWSVFQDPVGLANAMGGKPKMATKLDSIFSSAPTFDYSYYGFPIHEITEMLIMGMGQYAHGNQPIQHAVYLYNWVGQPWKAQMRARDIMKKLYQPTPDGLCGDEDNGQTSAWLVFSGMGFYPVCPAAGEYALGSPLFQKITLKLENDKTFTIEAPNNSDQNVYIQNAKLNQQPFSKNFLSHQQIMQGGTLQLIMGAKPNLARGVGAKDVPYSMSRE